MKIFVTGATGYLGSAIAGELVRAGHDVTALARSPQSAASVEARGMRARIGNLREPASYRDDALAHDAIVHAAIEGGADRLDVDRIFVEAVASPHLIYTSTMFVLGNVDGADESAPAHGPRAEHERIALDAGGAVIRPGMIVDPEGWLMQDPLFIGDGTNRWPLVRRDDCAVLYRLVAEQRARGVFHAVSEVALARDLTPGARSLPLEEARGVMGPFADMLALDQHVTAHRSLALGWHPTAVRR